MVAALHSVFPRRDLDHFSTYGYARNDDGFARCGGKPGNSSRPTCGYSERNTKEGLVAAPMRALNKSSTLPVSGQNLNHEENRLFCGALMQILNSGAWQLRINIPRDNEPESIGTLLEVNPPASPPLANGLT